jgi:hypothetical protein
MSIPAKWVLAGAVALTMSVSFDAKANLVQNNSFEDDGVNVSNLICPITSWTGCVGINAGETAKHDPILVGHAGYLAIGTVGSLGYVSQSISTVIGQDYRFTFMFSSDGDPANRFQAKWGSTVLMDVSDTPFDPNWTFFGCPFINDQQYESCVQNGGGGPAYYQFDVVATSTTTTISFGGQGDASGNSYVGIDDVFVTAVPEPDEAAVLAIALAAIGVARLRHSKRR